MPPRITRNSPRPRASDRTMVDLESPSLVALANSTAPLTHQRNLSEWTQVTLLQASLITVGWISRKPLPSGRGRSFFLTSLLIELIEVLSSVRLKVQFSLELQYDCAGLELSAKL